jgi:hypothetical protein
MARYYYGTVPALAWIINHYFYSRTHYAWLADAFYPHGTNPGSSNPYRLYGLLYEHWAESDEPAHAMGEYRRRLARGVSAKRRAGVLDRATAARVRRVCAFGSIDLFYPVLYRVEIDRIAPSRWVRAGSARKGSHEVLVKDLREPEFDLLFVDNARDDYFPQIVLGELEGTIRMHPMTALSLLETRVVP